ncbi:MAG: hypothetical protein ABSG51_04265 [Terracidiphilus sp.]
MAVERDIVTEELNRWNNANAPFRELMLHPVRWETHSSPQLGGHPQAILNEQVLSDADIVIGIFGTRIGTATPEYISGSVEEIKRHVAAGKLAIVYFSRVPVDPTTIDPTQFAALKAFKEECRSGGLCFDYESHDNFRREFNQHLSIELNKPKYLWMAKPSAAVEVKDPELGSNDKRLLLAAAADENGQVLVTSDLGGHHVLASGEDFAENTARSAAAWRRAVERLENVGYLERLNEEVYSLTEDGFNRADKETASIPLEISVSFGGTPDKQTFVVGSSKRVRFKKVDFLTSSEAHITSAELDEDINTQASIPIDHKKISELFAAPRPDRDGYDHSGPAALRLVFVSDGRRIEGVLPILLQPVSVANTRWVKLVGSKTFTFS